MDSKAVPAGKAGKAGKVLMLHRAYLSSPNVTALLSHHLPWSPTTLFPPTSLIWEILGPKAKQK